MPRINFIPPPMAFNDRSTALVQPIMSNAMQLADTFATEIPKIRMQQEAVAEDKRRYETGVATDNQRYSTGLKMKQDEFARAGDWHATEEDRAGRRMTMDEGNFKLRKEGIVSSERNQIRQGLQSNLTMDAVDYDGDGIPDAVNTGKAKTGLAVLGAEGLTAYQRAKLALQASKGGQGERAALMRILANAKVTDDPLWGTTKHMTPDEVNTRIDALLADPDADKASLESAQAQIADEAANPTRGTLMRTKERTIQARDYLRQLKAHIAKHPELAEDPATIAEYEAALADVQRPPAARPEGSDDLNDVPMTMTVPAPAAPAPAPAAPAPVQPKMPTAPELNMSGVIRARHEMEMNSGFAHRALDVEPWRWETAPRSPAHPENLYQSLVALSESVQDPDIKAATVALAEKVAFKEITPEDALAQLRKVPKFAEKLNQPLPPDSMPPGIAEIGSAASAVGNWFRR